MKAIDREFYSLIYDIIKRKEYIEQKKYRHHIKGSVYDHSVRVAYLCFKYCKKRGRDPRHLVMGALLHDYYLYDWHDGKNKMHLFSHPRRAYENAKSQFPLDRGLEDMILHHMFPIVPIPPRTREGWLICYFDKVASFMDYFGKNRWKYLKNRKNAHLCAKNEQK